MKSLISTWGTKTFEKAANKVVRAEISATFKAGRTVTILSAGKLATVSGASELTAVLGKASAVNAVSFSASAELSTKGVKRAGKVISATSATPAQKAPTRSTAETRGTSGKKIGRVVAARG